LAEVHDHKNIQWLENMNQLNHLKYSDNILYFVAIGAFIILLFVGWFINDHYLIVITVIANIAVITLMIKTINSTKESVDEQLKYWENKNTIQRKQFIKSLIQEIKKNINQYDEISRQLQEDDEDRFEHYFIMENLKRSLYNSHLDEGKTNKKLFILK
jgi:Co/Zn/Cd efflux system component